MNGNRYREFDDGRYYAYGNEDERLIWSHTADDTKPLRCSCGATTFRITQPFGRYETVATCTECGNSDTIHDG